MYQVPYNAEVITMYTYIPCNQQLRVATTQFHDQTVPWTEEPPLCALELSVIYFCPKGIAWVKLGLLDQILFLTNKGTRRTY